MDTTPQGNRYAPPAAQVADVRAADEAAPLASRGIRLGAALIDFVVIMLAMFAFSKIVGWDLFDTQEPGWQELLRNSVVGFGLFMALNGVLLLKHGQTIGKRLTGIRITRPDGGAVPPARLIGLRYGIGYLLAVLPWVQMVYALVDCLMIFGASRRCLHDHLAGSIVVRV